MHRLQVILESAWQPQLRNPGKQIDQIKTAEDIVRLNLKTVTNLGNGWHEAHMESKGVLTKYVGVEDSALRFLAAKRADIMIDALVSTNYLIKETGSTSELKLSKGSDPF